MTDDLLLRATHALRASTAEVDAPPADEAIERLESALRDGALALATTALRQETVVDEEPSAEALDRLESALGEARLERASIALRDEMRVDPDARDELAVARLDRARSRRSGRSRFARFVALPIAAVLVVMVGWASASGRLAHWIAIATHGEQERSEHD